jgi:hypothetical protein
MTDPDICFHSHGDWSIVGEVCHLDAAALESLKAQIEVALREFDYQEPEDNLTDVEADAMTLASAGWGTDEDYGYYGE